jgi:hypothetical protein
MAVTLYWQGPVGPGSFPRDTLAFERLCAAGVYLRTKRYDGDRIVAYAGQSVALLARFDQHLAGMLSLASPLRDSMGTVVFTGDAGERLAAYADLSNIAALAADDTARVQFWYAPCDDYFHEEYLNLAEGLIQRRLAQRLTAEYAELENAISAPGRLPDDVPDLWNNEFGDLDPAGHALLERLLGREPMSL